MTDDITFHAIDPLRSATFEVNIHGKTMLRITADGTLEFDDPNEAALALLEAWEQLRTATSPPPVCGDCGETHDPRVRCPNYHANMAPTVTKVERERQPFVIEDDTPADFNPFTHKLTKPELDEVERVMTGMPGPPASFIDPYASDADAQLEAALNAPVQPTERDIREANRILREKRGELPAPVQDDDAELERLSRLNPMYEGHEEDSLGLNIRMHVRAVLAARLTPDRVMPLVEALREADKRLCELTPNFPPDVGPDMRDAEEIEKTGAVVMQLRTALRDGGFDA